MNRLIALFAVGLLSACGGPLEDEQQQGPAAASQSSDLKVEAPPPIVPANVGPSEILGKAEPTITFDFSDGRINARLTMQQPEMRTFYNVFGHGGGCGCGCGH